MARKFYIGSDRDYKINDEIVINGEEFNHIKNVLRYRVGDELTVIDGRGNNYLCKINSINKNDLILGIYNLEKSEADPKINVVVYQALVKGEKLELIVQKLTELGISKFVPFYSEFCQVGPNTTRIDRLEKISIEALKQCGRSKKLEISDIISFNDLIPQLKIYDEVIFAYEKSTNPLNFENLKVKNNIAIIIGSEGGFSEKEANALISLKNINAISLGKRILRAETAAIALSTLVLFGVGELN